jgi:hypothetical protein
MSPKFLSILVGSLKMYMDIALALKCTVCLRMSDMLLQCAFKDPLTRLVPLNFRYSEVTAWGLKPKKVHYIEGSKKSMHLRNDFANVFRRHFTIVLHSWIAAPPPHTSACFEGGDNSDRGVYPQVGSYALSSLFCTG